MKSTRRLAMTIANELRNFFGPKVGFGDIQRVSWEAVRCVGERNFLPSELREEGAKAVAKMVLQGRRKSVAFSYIKDDGSYRFAQGRNFEFVKTQKGRIVRYLDREKFDLRSFVPERLLEVHEDLSDIPLPF